MRHLNQYLLSLFLLPQRFSNLLGEISESARICGSLDQVTSQKHRPVAKHEHTVEALFSPSAEKLRESDCFETMVGQTGISLLHPAVDTRCLLFKNTKELVSSL